MLDGTLAIILEGGFEPVEGATFVIMTSDVSVSGIFATINGVDIGNGTHFEISYGASTVTLEVFAD